MDLRIDLLKISILLQRFKCFNPVERKYKLTDQIPMRTVQLNPRKARIGHQPRSINELPLHPLDIRNTHLPLLIPDKKRDDPQYETVAEINRNPAWSHRLAEESAFTGAAQRLPAGMADLHEGRHAMLLAGVGVFFPWGDRAGFAFVFGLEGWVVGAAEVVYVDLDVAFFY